MFDSLVDKMNAAFKKFRSKGKLTEADVREGMREIKLALLEADVNFKVVRDFIKRVTESAVGADVLESLMPGQQIIKIVNDELTETMGGTQSKLTIASKPPTVVMMTGLQGAGKTTHAAKLAGLYKKQGKRPLLVACDVYRPAAVKQLQVVGAQLDIPVFAIEGERDAVKIAREGVEHAIKHGNDMVFIDTAGRLHIDEDMMHELEEIKAAVNPTEILLVVDAMLGQDAVNTAKAFNDRLPLTGIVLTKADGDSRGGASLSVRYVTGKPIKFIGTGEKLGGFEPFDPEAMASRILGMGDIVGLVKDVTKSIDMAEAAKLAEKIRTGDKFDLTDFRAQLQQMAGFGSFSSLMEKMPAQLQQAASKVSDEDVQKNLRRTLGIIDSMTLQERRKPELIKASRKKRIAAGAGVPVQEVNRLLKQFEQTQDMMKRMKRGGLSKMMRMLGGMKLPGMGGGFPGGFPPGGFPGMPR